MAGYTPTPQERLNTTAQGNFLKVSGDREFATLQGEGVSAGAPAVFLRLQNCNLRCGADDLGWKCDAWYTWDKTTPEYWQETANLPVERVADVVQSSWDNTFGDVELAPRLVVTGGEPLLQQGKLPRLFDRLPGWGFEIETNGTLLPVDDLRQAQINCSPKLASSGNTWGARYRPRALRQIADFSNHWFKFVITPEQLEEDIAEVKSIVEDISIDPARVILMSEGVTADRLRGNEERLTQVAQSLGFITTSRNHIFWYGDKRAT